MFNHHGHQEKAVCQILNSLMNDYIHEWCWTFLYKILWNLQTPNIFWMTGRCGATFLCFLIDVLGNLLGIFVVFSSFFGFTSSSSCFSVLLTDVASSSLLSCQLSHKPEPQPNIKAMKTLQYMKTGSTTMTHCTPHSFVYFGKFLSSPCLKLTVSTTTISWNLCLYRMPWQPFILSASHLPCVLLRAQRSAVLTLVQFRHTLHSTSINWDSATQGMLTTTAHSRQ